MFSQRIIIVLPLLFTVLFGACKKDDDEERATKTYSYTFNVGAIGESYVGTHPKTMASQVTITEQANGKSKLTVMLTNTLSGKTYNVHFHEAMAGSTPPYNQTPRYIITVTGNGSTAINAVVLSDSFETLTAAFKGFYVVHDPTQTLSTTDFKTFLIVGAYNQ